MTIRRLNPDTLHKNPAFTQVAVIEPGATLVHVGGQNAVDADGNIVGHDIASQTAQALKNVVMALAAAGASLRDVFKMTVYIVPGQSVQEGFAAAQQFTDLSTHPPTISVLVVAALGHPDFLIEIDATAAIQQE
ncbi:MAG: RidA family protein [Anaerolineae bacterium]|nr:RidA family protein [Anaerolineae bacterium]